APEGQAVTPLLCATHSPQTLLPRAGNEAVADRPEQAEGKQSDVEAAGRCRRGRPEVGSWPDKAIQLTDNDPGTSVVEVKTPFDRCGQLDSTVGVPRLAVRDRQHADNGFAGLGVRAQDDGARTVLNAFFTSLQGIGVPEIGVPDNQARLRRG